MPIDRKRSDRAQQASAAKARAKAAKRADREARAKEEPLGREAMAKQRPPKAEVVLSAEAERITPRYLQADLVGTVAMAAAIAVAALSDSDAATLVQLSVSAVLFLAGCVAFAIGFFRAADRSRRDELYLAGLYYLTDAAPAGVRRRFLLLWFAQIALAVAAVPLNKPPFAVMAPLWGVGLMNMWSSKHGTFPPLADTGRR